MPPSPSPSSFSGKSHSAVSV
ncbi:hypothetical protein E2C01_027948 [Portunus trituberculatus]|uniref:Uncharacterized protein n=1 Tax=Portunus trituberculatus TaxID=210409 RepID=A0A5B7EMX6_PORTR|nr:hypothetical protein [Portunus trituberculatus]